MPFAEFVDPEHRYESVPCHHISLDETGETVERLENTEDQAKLERKVKDWLRFRIREIEEQRASQASREPASRGQKIHQGSSL